ncbi:MAG: hypothetical protein ACRKGH_08510 [Dehalogenimonas sp.]
MSNRFNDLLEKTRRGNGRPLGFGQYATPVKQRLFIIAQAADNKKGAALPGIDAIFVPGACACQGEKTGILRGCTGPAGTGCDFIVTDLDGAVDADPGEDTARLLTIKDDLPDAQLRTLSGLDIAAVIATVELGDTLTFRDLLAVQRLADFSSKPVMLNLPKLYSKIELQALWHRGIAGVMVDSASVDTAALRELVDSLEPKKRDKDRVTALAGTTAGTAPAIEEEEEPEIDPETEG